MELTKKSLLFYSICLIAIVDLIGTIAVASKLCYYVDPVLGWFGPMAKTYVNIERANIIVPLLFGIIGSVSWFFVSKYEGVVKLCLVAAIICSVLIECCTKSAFCHIASANYTLEMADKMEISSDWILTESDLKKHETFQERAQYSSPFITNLSKSTSAFCALSYMLLIMVIIYWANEILPDPIGMPNLGGSGANNENKDTAADQNEPAPAANNEPAVDGKKEGEFYVNE